MSATPAGERERTSDGHIYGCLADGPCHCPAICKGCGGDALQTVQYTEQPDNDQIVPLCRRCFNGAWNSFFEEGGMSSDDPTGAARNEPRCRGVARMADNDRAILLSFDRPISDDELRALHDSLRHRLPAPPASEAGHREDSDEGPGLLLWPEGSDERIVRDIGAFGIGAGKEPEGSARMLSWYEKMRASQESLLARLRQLRADRSGPGTPLYRLTWLLDQLSQRFAVEKPFSSEGSEPRYLAAIDALAAENARLRADGERLREKNHAMAAERDEANSRTLRVIGEIDTLKRTHAETLAAMVEDHARSNGALAARVAALEAALEPFTHPDLSEQFGGNVEGAESPVFGRNKAVLRLKDFRAARAALRPGAPREEGAE